MINTNTYHRLNTTVGWFVFIIAAFTYLSTMESTGSFWDCGEYIACAYKLEVGHPPGAPLFLLIGRFFSLFAFGHTEKVGVMINSMSALCAAFTILFLFWTITAMARKIVDGSGALTPGKMIAVVGSGAVGALAYTFSDSFWFSAVEGEVYAMSSFFTAITFWAILRWEREADQPHANRWIILIAYLIGLAVGVHLLNLLVIPGIVFIYYFRKNANVTRKGIIITGCISILILGGIQAGIIPLIVKLAAWFEITAVNAVGLPFNSGTIIYGVLLIGGIVFGLQYTTKHAKPILNTIILCFTVILIGYSSFLVLVIRSQANPPMDENNPDNAVNLLSYLNREQYGTWPILYGQYFSAPTAIQHPYKDGNPVYVKDEKTKRYIISDDRKGSIPDYDERFCTFFPRMWSDQAQHVRGYKAWTNPRNYQHINVTNPQTGEIESVEKPSFAENLKFFFSYQVGQMYGRYFLWDFVGRQNDIQGHGQPHEGNWISGLPVLENPNIGGIKEGLPNGSDHNKGKNILFGLPLILGLIGLFYQLKKDKRNATVIGLLFFFTGLAIVIYLNQRTSEPRERDYAYTGSFYAFAIWIGLGVLAVFDLLQRKLNQANSAVAATTLCLLAVPSIMVKEEWNDHNRANRYIARDFAANYLNSCAPNAILFTNGDNDTFPLWYAQEVEGIRTDVRVICLEYLNMDWYIDQLVHRAYKSAPIPFSLKKEQYRQGGPRDAVFFRDLHVIGHIPVKELMDFISSDDTSNQVDAGNGKRYSFFPTKNMRIPVDSTTVVNNGTVPKELANRIVKNIDWTMTGNYVQKNDLMIIDLLAHNDWKRPIYFAATAAADSYLGLASYLQLEGLAYRLVPVKQNEQESQQETRIATDIMYNNVMNKFAWGGMDVKGMYLDDVFISGCALNIRQRMGALAATLIEEGKKDKAINVLDRVVKVTPQENVPYDATMFAIALAYYQADATEKANEISKKLFDNFESNLNYYYAFDRKRLREFGNDPDQAQDILERLTYFAHFFKQPALAKEFQDRYTKLLKAYGLSSRSQSQQGVSQ
jgi:tetratricopeptide (TPR) repeat protein